MSTAIRDPRLCLRVGSSCSIYSRSAKKWYPGTIDKIIIDSNTNKEWLTVKYCTKSKKMQRFCQDLKVISINQNKHQSIPPNTNTKQIQSKHTSKSAILTTNRRPPVRATFPNYPNSTGRGRGTNHFSSRTARLRPTTRGGRRTRGRGRGRIVRHEIDYDRIMRMKLPRNNTLKYGWISLSTPHFEILPASNLVAISKNELAIATEFSFYPPFGGIYKYNTVMNTWNILMAFPENIPFAKGGSFSLTFNEEANELFLYGAQVEPQSKHSLIAKIDVMKMKYELIYVPRNRSIPIEASAVIINGQYHVVGGQGWSHSTHSILDIETGKFTSPFKLWQGGAIPYGLIAVKAENKLLALGDCAPNKALYRRYKHCANEIWEHCVGSKMWYLMNIRLPYEMVNFGYILTSDEKYVIIFGGVCTNEKELIDLGVSIRKRLDGIYILDMEMLKVYECDIRCPMVGDFDAVLMSAVCMKDARDLVNGYIKRYVFRGDDVWVPMDIVNLISFYCKNEYVHLMQRKEIFAKHWKICIEDILNSMKEYT